MATLAVLDAKGKKEEQLDLPDDIFGITVNQDVLYQALVMYRACQRQGTLDTKERAFVSGGGKKPYRQKGTGRARAGSSRSPLWKGGGVTFGPHPRDFSYSIPKKIKMAALRESLNAKYQNENLVCVNELTDKISKTKDFARILAAWKPQGKVLALLDGCDDSVNLVSRNIPRFQLLRADDVNAYDILKNKTVIVSKTSVAKILKRIKPSKKAAGKK